jgi:hypothetical protein
MEEVYGAHKHIDPRPVGNKSLRMVTPDYLTTNQSKKCPRADYALLLEHYKTPYYVLQGQPHGLQGISPLWPLLPGKAIKATLFYFAQNSVSMFLFSISEHRLNFRNTINMHTGDKENWILGRQIHLLKFFICSQCLPRTELSFCYELRGAE